MKYLDSNIFLYPILYNDLKSNVCRKILLSVAKNELSACTSALSWDEIVFVIRKVLGKELSVKEGKKFLAFPNLVFSKVDSSVVMKAQELIERYSLKPRDAIHLASAIISQCDEFVSDDGDFKEVKEIRLRRI